MIEITEKHEIETKSGEKFSFTDLKNCPPKFHFKQNSLSYHLVH